ncbi:dienelactone hydrolase family protein [Rhizobium ruizarguesonis]|uniref:dienelactone hydrolase family protein n=1 Tax=Rhizobium leguminosarum TaxID=384 RepID=UPI0010307896|nr:alpha/beta hydrolase [Rhizobium leguminosarum]TAV50202.1 dienelactone hydrolase [Rhizobium leguminosarum]TAV59565.1 dienelactone hydrolase [Rhizobium leguminosarum]TAV70612.1 dienelactone hydrolase [Rhizobium leguminosarum]TAY68229.1 dienelactone hydrolase [Rhizobium leguminosarum]
MKFEKFFIPSDQADARLEVVLAKPQSDGPHPTVVFNHGSTGRGHNKSLYSRTVCPAAAANYFVEKGWMVLFPQRRGRGKSGGGYGEGLAPDGSGYSCDVDITIAGFERAVEDVDAVVRHLRERSDVVQGQLAIAGVSRGGILSIAYAGMRPNTFRGAINFNGGWLGRGCPSHEVVNPSIFERGARAGIPTLWLHGSFDQYYRIEHCRENFERFLSAGGKGKFVAAPMGHALLFKPALWERHLDQYMSDLDEPRNPRSGISRRGDNL